MCVWNTTTLCRRKNLHSSFESLSLFFSHRRQMWLWGLRPANLGLWVYHACVSFPSFRLVVVSRFVHSSNDRSNDRSRVVYHDHNQRTTPLLPVCMLESTSPLSSIIVVKPAASRSTQRLSRTPAEWWCGSVYEIHHRFFLTVVKDCVRKRERERESPSAVP